MRAISSHIDSLVPQCPPEHQQPLQEIRSIFDEQLLSLKAESDEVSLLMESYSKYTNCKVLDSVPIVLVRASNLFSYRRFNHR